VLDERERHWLTAPVADCRAAAPAAVVSSDGRRGACPTSVLAGKRIAVLGSGDNLVVFALAGMGARVTSVDISANQLAIARQRAAELGLPVEFVRSDVSDLSALSDSTFDLIYTGGHIAIWVSDLRKFYAEAARILKPDGRLLVSEYHPFRRLWKDNTDRLELEADYFQRGPYEYDSSGTASRAAASGEDGGSGSASATGKTYEFQWTVGDYINAVIAAQCEVEAVEEFGTGSDGAWELAPVGGLPRVLLVVGRKR
jgi:SAM-dependent methyltransferase